MRKHDSAPSLGPSAFAAKPQGKDPENYVCRRAAAGRSGIRLLDESGSHYRRRQGFDSKQKRASVSRVVTYQNACPPRRRCVYIIKSIR